MCGGVDGYKTSFRLWLWNKVQHECLFIAFLRHVWLVGNRRHFILTVN